MNDLGGRSYPPAVAPAADEKSMGMLAHLLGIVGFLGPLIIWLVKKDQSKYVAKQAMEALMFQVALGVLAIILMILSFITCGLGAILYFPWLILWILYIVVATVKANEGLIYEYPLTSRFVNMPMDEGTPSSMAPLGGAPRPPQPPEE